MAFCLKRKEPVEQGLKRIAHEQLDKAIAELTDSQFDPHDTVHQVRKRCKKLRGLVRLARPQWPKIYQHENARYRDLARELSSVRDAHSIVETYDELVDHDANEFDAAIFASIRQQLVARRERIAEDETGLRRRLDQALLRMREAKQRVDAWSLDAGGFEAVGGGLRKTYRRGRRAMRTARDRPTTENFHQWRKRAKYHWYHTRLMRRMWNEVLNQFRQETHRLSDLLGDDHDLAILHQTLTEQPAAFGPERRLEAFVGLIDRRRRELRTEAGSLGQRIYCEKSKRLANRWSCYWSAWKSKKNSRATASPQLISAQ